jgi:hypothetical protein
MRRATALLLASFALALFGFGVSACGGDDNKPSGETTTETTTEEHGETTEG